MRESLEKAAHTVGVALGSIAVLFVIVLIIALGAMINGLVIWTMWGWFVTPLGLPALGFAQAIGLGFFVRYLTWQHAFTNKDDEDKDAQARRLIVVFVYPFLVLGLGFIAHLFM